MNNLRVACFSVFLSSCVVAQSSAIVIPDQDTQRLNTLNRNLTVGAFLNTYMGADVEQRRLAEMYVVGVLDATEGAEWCDYETLSPGGLQEQVLVALKKAKGINSQQRVSTAIKARFKEFFPCKDAKLNRHF